MSFLNIFLTSIQMSHLMKIHPVGVNLFSAGGWIARQTDMKLVLTLCSFANAPKNVSVDHLDHAYVQSH